MNAIIAGCVPIFTGVFSNVRINLVVVKMSLQLNNIASGAIENGRFSIVGLPYTVYIVSGIFERITIEVHTL
jgi:hypothetical protein